MRDQAWQFVFGFLACVLTVVGLLQVPQATPIRMAIPQALSGKYTPQPELTPTPIPTFPPLAKAETLSKYYTFRCLTSCVMPFVLTLQTIQVSSQNNNMIWTFSIVNNTQNHMFYNFSQLTIQSRFDDQPITSSGLMTEAGESAVPGPNQMQTETQTFPILPYSGTSYTATITVHTYDTPDITFSPYTVTF
jgi:hypothetical protein